MEENLIAFDAHLLWNIVLTFILMPLGFLIRNLLSEQKRIDILINKTREEVAKDYVTREQLSKELERLMDTLDRIDTKIDRLQNKTYFQE
jgi:division protein CdvB (Snf7/Vps24/ESCRT-III family)